MVVPQIIQVMDGHLSIETLWLWHPWLKKKNLQPSTIIITIKTIHHFLSHHIHPIHPMIFSPSFFTLPSTIHKIPWKFPWIFFKFPMVSWWKITHPTPPRRRSWGTSAWLRVSCRRSKRSSIGRRSWTPSASMPWPYGMVVATVEPWFAQWFSSMKRPFLSRTSHGKMVKQNWLGPKNIRRMMENPWFAPTKSYGTMVEQIWLFWEKNTEKLVKKNWCFWRKLVKNPMDKWCLNPIFLKIWVVEPDFANASGFTRRFMVVEDDWDILNHIETTKRLTYIIELLLVIVTV